MCLLVTAAREHGPLAAPSPSPTETIPRQAYDAGSDASGTRVAGELLCSPADFDALAPEWIALHQASGTANPFLTYDWTRACWDYEGAGTLAIFTVRADGRLIGIAPLCVEVRHGLRLLRFIADDRSDYLGFLCLDDDPDIEKRLLREVLALSGEWDVLILRRLTDAYSSLAKADFGEGFGAHLTRWTTAPFCTWDGDWNSLHQGGPSWFKEMRKRRRRFLRDGGVYTRLTGAEAISRLGDVADIEARSWKGRQRTTRLQEGAGQQLLRRAFGTLGERAQMQLWLAEVRGSAVGFQIDFTPPGRLLHYQCAFDERFSSTRAGSVLAYSSLEHGWQHGVREFDYLSGDEAYKLQRTNACRPISQLAVHRRTVRGRAAYLILAGLRSRLRHVPSLRRLHSGLQILRRAVGVQTG